MKSLKEDVRLSMFMGGKGVTNNENNKSSSTVQLIFVNLYYCNNIMNRFGCYRMVLSKTYVFN